MNSRLTAKNKQAIEVYLGAGSPEAKGSGTKSWQEVYGTKSERTAQANWSRMLSNSMAQKYLEQRRKEIQDAVTERIAYDVEQAVQDLVAIQTEARGSRDYGAAVKAVVEAMRVQGKYVSKSESTSLTVSADDLVMAAHYGMSPSEYMQRKQDQTLPDPPPLPDLH